MTGVIGQIIPIEPFEEHMKELAGGLSADGNDKAANAIMTTDTVDKQVAVDSYLVARPVVLVEWQREAV